MPLTDEQHEMLRDGRSTAAYLGDTPAEQFKDAESDPVANVRLFRDLLSIIDTLQADVRSSLRWVSVSEGLPVMEGRTPLCAAFITRVTGSLCVGSYDRWAALGGGLAFYDHKKTRCYPPADITHYCIITGPEEPTT